MRTVPRIVRSGVDATAPGLCGHVPPTSARRQCVASIVNSRYVLAPGIIADAARAVLARHCTDSAPLPSASDTLLAVMRRHSHGLHDMSIVLESWLGRDCLDRCCLRSRPNPRFPSDWHRSGHTLRRHQVEPQEVGERYLCEKICE